MNVNTKILILAAAAKSVDRDNLTKEEKIVRERIEWTCNGMKIAFSDLQERASEILSEMDLMVPEVPSDEEIVKATAPKKGTGKRDKDKTQKVSAAKIDEILADHK